MKIGLPLVPKWDGGFFQNKLYKMTYATLEELCERELTQDEVIGILENHSQTDEDIYSFFREEGYKDLYMGSEVLIWLGY